MAKPPAKRMRPPPEPEEDKRDPKSKGAGATLEELTKVVEQLWAERPGNFKVWKEATDVINDHASRLDEIEHQDMHYNDRINLVAEHCQVLTRDTDANLRTQMDTFSAESVRCINALEEGVIKGMQAQQGGF